MKKRSTLMSLALVACLPFVTSAKAQEGSPKDQQKEQQNDQQKSDKSSQSSQKVEGIVAGVTVVGETMVDYETNRAAVAQVTYLTVVGKPTDEKSGASTHEASKSDAKKQA